MANANACIAERRSCIWGQPQAQQSFVKKRPEARPGNFGVKHLTCGVHTVGPVLTPRRPLGCIFPEVWFEDTEVQYMDADRGHSSYKRSL
jgi:hypothetical protein